jgi:CopG-like RHH_1 or ribbon-helix-helix domain, RHH_5
MTGVVKIDIKVPSRRKADVITAYLDKEVKQVLEVWAQSEQRSLSSLVAYLLTKAASSYQTEHPQSSDRTISPEEKNERSQH